MKKAFYTVLPSVLLSDTRLTATARIVYAVIENLTHKDGECYASNEYIIRVMGGGINERTLQRAITLLERYGYLEREIVSQKKVQNERYIRISNRWKTEEITQGGGDKNDTTGVTKMTPPYIVDEKQSNKIIYNTRGRVNEIFELIWDQFPKQRRGSKQKANEVLWTICETEKLDPQIVLDAVPGYLKSEEVDIGRAQYLVNWLHNRGWESVYKPAKEKPKPYTPPPRPECPHVVKTGINLFYSEKIKSRYLESDWEQSFDQIVSEWAKNSPDLHRDVIRTALASDPKITEKQAVRMIYLALNPDVSNIDSRFAEQWWSRAYRRIKDPAYSDPKGIVEMKKWQDIVEKVGLDPVYNNYDWSPVAKRVEEIYKKIGRAL